MNRSSYRNTAIPVLFLTSVMLGSTKEMAAQQDAPPGQTLQQTEPIDQPGVETLTRGPIHEGFAEVVAYDPQPGITAPRQPPTLIEELPPEQRPEDEEAIWIPGYWSWSEDQNDFIWISGVWRVPPPGAEWIPGYWDQVDNGYRWISGYWWSGADQQQQQEMSYLPVPPRTLESGPNSPQPADDQFWVPGSWIWQDTRYVWRTGYWAQIRLDWVWIPDRYLWTPSGCVFVPGHWDYTMPRRGLCFAPVRLQPAVYAQPTFRYVPIVLVDVHVIQYHLFCRPAYNHYYFGDYYDPRYRTIGIQPWFALYQGAVAYEPFYVYNRWYFRHHKPERDWSGHVRRWFDHRVRHPDARPPHTYRAMQDLLRREGRDRAQQFEVALSIDEAKRRPEFPARLVPVDEQRRDRMIELRRNVQDFSRQRERLERQARERFADGKPDRPEQIRFPTPPVRGTLPEFAERPEQVERQSGRLPEVPQRRPGAKERPDAPRLPAPDLPEPPVMDQEKPQPPKPERPRDTRQPPTPDDRRQPDPRQPDVRQPDRRQPDVRQPREREQPPDQRRPGRPEQPDRLDLPRQPRQEERPEQPRRPERQDRFEQPGRQTPQQPQDGRRFERPEQPSQPRGTSPDARRDPTRQDRVQPPDPGPAGRQRDGLRRDESRRGAPQDPVGGRGQTDEMQRRALRPSEQQPGFRGPDESRQRQDPSRRSERLDQPQGSRGGQDARSQDRPSGMPRDLSPERSGGTRGREAPSPFGGGQRDGARSSRTAPFDGGDIERGKGPPRATRDVGKEDRDRRSPAGARPGRGDGDQREQR